MSRSTETLACSLTGAEMRERAHEARALADRSLLRREATAGGLRLRFTGSPEVEDAVRSFVRREKLCCPFFKFSLARDGAALELTVSAPPEAGPLLDSLFAPA
jgi:hypothetical protein